MVITNCWWAGDLMRVLQGATTLMSTDMKVDNLYYIPLNKYQATSSCLQMKKVLYQTISRSRGDGGGGVG